MILSFMGGLDYCGKGWNVGEWCLESTLRGFRWEYYDVYVSLERMND